MKALLSAALLFIGIVAAAPAAEPAVDVAVVLAIDASGSVDDRRFALQIDGYARALRSPEFLQAVRNRPLGKIAVTAVEWSGAHRQRQVAGWTLIEDEKGARALADALAAWTRIQPDWTSISGAIDYSARLLLESGYTARRRVIDVSSDGANNDGRPAAAARDAAVALGIVINGLPILGVEPDLDVYYRLNVIGGPGAFIVPVADERDIARAILKKLTTEIAAAPATPPVLPR